MLASYATVPYAEIKFKNLKLDSKQKIQIDNAWFRYLKENQKALYSNDKNAIKQKYKSDQFCRFNGELLSDGSIDLDSLKLEKHKKNFEFNLAAIDFLRKHDYKFANGKKNPNKKIKASFAYYSF